MHYFERPIKCSKCGSYSNETFHRGPYISGRRCLSCGHEHIEDNTPTHDSISWSQDSNEERKF